MASLTGSLVAEESLFLNAEVRRQMEDTVYRGLYEKMRDDNLYHPVWRDMENGTHQLEMVVEVN